MVLGQRGTHVTGSSAALTLLGRWRLRVGDQEILLGRRERRLLACLAISGAHSRDWLAATLWPDADSERATACLRTTLWSLRREVPGLTCVTGRLLKLATDVESDLEHLQHSISKIISGRQSTPAVDEAMRAVPSLLADELLPGWYEDWVLLERERLRNRQLEALKAMARQALDAGRPRPAIQYARAAIEIEPHDDDNVLLLITAQLDLGHIADALRAFHQYRTRLGWELGADPSPRVRGVVERALASSTSGVSRPPNRSERRPDRTRTAAPPKSVVRL
ncbi:MAG TPA: BTAD domain-containing putative transcriptional regulator [Microlunatus sp.]